VEGGGDPGRAGAHNDDIVMVGVGHSVSILCEERREGKRFVSKYPFTSGTLGIPAIEATFLLTRLGVQNPQGRARASNQLYN
jgi:hypothetical protein